MKLSPRMDIGNVGGLISKLKTIVVHCKKHEYDVYIGRGCCPRTGLRSRWGNPFRIGVDGTRTQVIEKYREYILNNVELLVALEELRGKRLGCWCVDEPVDHAREHKQCHGEVLLELLEDV